MNEEERLLDDAVKAIKVGDKAAARKKLFQVLSLDRANSKAWLWFSAVVDSDAQRYECLQNVLRIDPHHQAALQGIEALKARMSPQASPHDSPPPEKRKKPKSALNVLSGLFIGGGLGLLACVIVIYIWLSSSPNKSQLPWLTALTNNFPGSPVTRTLSAGQAVSPKAAVIPEDWHSGRDINKAFTFRFPPHWDVKVQSPGVVIFEPAIEESIRLQVIEKPFPYDRADENSGASQFCQDQLQTGEGNRALLSQELWPYAGGGYMCYFTSGSAASGQAIHQIELISPLGNERFALVTLKRSGSKATEEELQQLEVVLTSIH